MPRDDGAEQTQKKTVLYKDPNLPIDRRPKRVIISKSRYKLYEPPQRSNFSVCLDNIKRERQSISVEANKPTTSSRTTPYRKLERGSDEFPQSGPNMFTSFARPQSSMVLTERRKLYFKDALIEYKRRRPTVPRRIKIIKVYAPLNWEEAFEESVKKHTPSFNIENPWRQPRLQWLQDLENEPQKLPRDSDETETPCCPLLMFTFRKHKSR